MQNIMFAHMCAAKAGNGELSLDNDSENLGKQLCCILFTSYTPLSCLLAVLSFPHLLSTTANAPPACSFFTKGTNFNHCCTHLWPIKSFSF